MKYYQEITLIPQLEIPMYFIWSKIYQQLHFIFVNSKLENDLIPFGVSFPEYIYEPNNKKINLGSKLRIFSQDKKPLEELDLKGQALSKFSDYIHVTSIRDVPSKNIVHSLYQRYQQEGSVEKDARRFCKRHAKDNITLEQAVRLFSKKKRRIEAYPFIHLKSLSRKSDFRLSVKKEIKENEYYEGFSTYGLSAKSTVPDF